jgi:starvation-inducible outer membrane lipoprotein
LWPDNASTGRQVTGRREITMIRILLAASLAALLGACTATPDSSSGAQSDTQMANPRNAVRAQPSVTR